MSATHLRTVEFHGDRIGTVERDGEFWIAVKPIAEALGLSWSGQFERLKRDPLLSEGVRIIRMEGQSAYREITVLRLDLLQGWLFGIDASRVRADRRDRVLEYQRECYAALHAHFYRRRDGVEPAQVPDYVKRALVNEARMTFGPAAARELWRELGLPLTPAMNAAPPQGALQLEGGR